MTTAVYDYGLKACAKDNNHPVCTKYNSQTRKGTIRIKNGQNFCNILTQCNFTYSSGA